MVAGNSHKILSVLKKFVLACITFLSCHAIFSQDMHGIAVSDYSGVSRSFLNPGSMIHSKTYFDLLLIGGSAFAQNNYLYVPRRDYTLSRLRYLDFPTYPETGQKFLDDYNQELKYGFASLRITGPSAMLVKRNHAFAIQHSIRSVATVDHLPYDVAKFMLEGLSFEPQQNFRYTHDKPYTIGSLGWYELGFTYNNMIYKLGDVNFSAGATVKRLWAYHGLFVHSTYTDYMTPDSDTLILYRLNAVGGMAGPVNYQENDFTGLSNPVKGNGFAIDLGVSYVRTLEPQSTRKYTKDCAYPYEPYLFRIGFSVLDFGSVKLDRNVRRMEFNEIDTVWTGVNSLEFLNFNQLLSDLSNELGGSPGALLREGEFRIALPTYASFQFDYNFQNDLFLNLVVVQDLPVLNNRLSRPSYVSLSPRYATDVFELSLPFSLYRYREPRLGAALRFYNFSIGTEKLGGFFGLSDFDGIDLYFSVQVSMMKGNCGKRFGGLRNCHQFN